MPHGIEQLMAEASDKAETYELFENIPTNPSTTATMGHVINQRYALRSILRGALAVSAIGAIA